MLRTKAHIRALVKGDKLKGPLLVICHFVMPLPASFRLAQREILHGTYHFKKPDGDNLEKFINDACQGIMWTDDSQVACMVRRKVWTKAKEGKTVFFVTEIDPYPQNIGALIEPQMNLENIL